ncbi:MAG: PH domain-containing protein [Bifidobacteriaceae bacterium]|nr:PH domain-containing protein [Bifidobacteriaceae bacterium]
MGFNPSELAAGEYVIFHARAHWKVLVAPVLVLIVAVTCWLVFWLKVIPEANSWNWARWAVAALAAAAVVIWTIAPIVRWACRTDTLTNYRLISREGVFKREGRDIPMDRVHAVSYQQTFIERLLGAGTLHVQTAAQQSDVALDDVAHVKRRQLQINEQLLDRDFEAVAPDSAAGRSAERASGRFAAEDDGEDNEPERH